MPTPTLTPPTGPPDQPAPADPPAPPHPGPGWLRPAFRWGGSLLAAALLLQTGWNVIGLLAHEQETLVDEVDAAAVTTVDVHNSAGPVHIVAAPETDDVITVTARIHDGLSPTRHGHHLEDDRLVVEGSCPVWLSTFCRASYTIEVPRDVDVVIDTDERASVSDISGDVEVHADNGRVEVSRVTGDLVLEADNGRITGEDLAAGTVDVDADNGSIEVAFAEPPQAVVASSNNGSVELILPDDDVSYAVDASSDNGSVSTPIQQDPDSDRTIHASSDNGSVTVRYPS